MIQQANTYWAELQPYRSERLRCKNYTYGKQWNDLVNYRERLVTEYEYIREQGHSPLKNNLIRKIVRNVLGVFRSNYGIPTFEEAVGNLNESGGRRALKAAYERIVAANSLMEIYSRVMEEYLIGGLAVVRKRFSLQDGGTVFTDIVRPESFFFNTDAVDPRGHDITMIGEIHNSHNSNNYNNFNNYNNSNNYNNYNNFYEIWRREVQGWRYYFIDAEGRTLREGDSPFPSGCHPYVMKAYPFIDGEIHSFVADCIDQQRYINRLITLNDWIIQASAKGVLLFPESAIPDDLDLQDIADMWTRYNGVIRYKAKTGVPMPQQISTNSTNIGISELLQVQLKMMEDVSGVNAALQGQLSSGAVSGTLYEQQTRHALTGLLDILEGFKAFMLESARKDIELAKLKLND